MSELPDYLKEQADRPQWGKVEKVHDWRNHVPSEIRAIWFTFSQGQRFALTKWADEMATSEHWD